MDPKTKRVKYNGKSVITLEDFKVEKTTSCKDFPVNFIVDLNELFQPVQIEMKYTIVKPKLENFKFCETCLAVDNENIRNKVIEIHQDHGCEHQRCITDLKLSSYPTNNYRFERGSSDTLSFDFTVMNSGELSYGTQLTVNIPRHIEYAQMPTSCKNYKFQNTNQIVCELYNKSPIKNGGTSSQKIDLDMLTVDKPFSIDAFTNSVGSENRTEKNSMTLAVNVVEMSKVQVFG